MAALFLSLVLSLTALLGLVSSSGREDVLATIGTLVSSAQHGSRRAGWKLHTMEIGNAVSAAECEESQAVPARRACTQIRWAGAQGGQTAALFGVLLSCLSSLFKSFVRPVMHVPITLTTAFTAFLAVLLRTWRQCLCNALSMLTAESHV